MDLSEVFNDYKQYIILTVVAVMFLLLSFMLDIVKIGLIVTGLCIIAYIAISIIRKKNKKDDKDKFYS
jgi:hypothetical protein